MTYEEIKIALNEALANLEEPKNKTLGNFYKLYSKERDYHEPTLYAMFKSDLCRKHLLTILLNKKNEKYDDNIRIVNNLIEKEKQITKDESEDKKVGRIDLYFELSKQDKWDRKPIIIELKTNSDNHDGQLTRYYNYKKKSEPFCFYISLDGKLPLYEKPEKEDILKNNYTSLSYFELIELLKEETIGNPIFSDYIKTIRENDSRNSTTNSSLKQDISPLSVNQALYYYYYFTKVKEKLQMYNIDSIIECYYIEPNDKNLPRKHTQEITFRPKKEIEDNNPDEIELIKMKSNEKITDSDFKNNFIYLKIKITKKIKENGTEKIANLALERRWQMGKNSFIYGIHDSYNNFNTYINLIDFWSKVKDERTFKKHITQNKGNNKLLPNFSGGQDSKQIPKEYILAQILDLEMKYLEQIRIINGVNDLDTWVNRIKEDLDRIQ